ncbi:MAG: peptidoglycan DD-metalloendopeptidase family protein [Bacteroidetes bacterium]|nr:peptidoglycan DD-metalloendopeptidase family protein [Bacteroidota bacterium]MBS1540000.1 peptidoglycan DD-metalloendopeptidase family protein [Bacteroidota bacterium]
MIAGRVNWRWGVCLFAGLSFYPASAQRNKTQLQRERQQNIERIRETEKILEETSKEKKSTLGELMALNKRIEQQEQLMGSTKSEINLLSDDIDEDNQIIEALQKDVTDLKEEYAAMLFAAQKASGKTDKLTFLFSAQTVDQLLMRLKYMEQYGKARQEQARAISKAQQLLSEQVRVTEQKRNEKQNLLDDEVKQNHQMTQLKQKQRKVVNNLEKEEKRLRRELEETKRAVAELDELIAKIVKEELERAAREARERNKSKTKGKEVIASEETLALSSSFEENKSKFPWPVSGFVSQHFGRQMHPILRGIEVQNDGVNIQTKANEPVHAIFDGHVSRVAFIKGIGNTIIISHGEYFSVYSGLKDVFVKPGQKISVNEEIGRVLTTAEGISELRFQIRKNIVALDPQQWLKN